MVRSAIVVWICITAFSVRTDAAEPARAQSSTSASRDAPPHLLVVRLSPNAFRFRDLDRGQVNETTPVYEVVLGTRAVGTARVRGHVSFQLEPNRDGAGLTLTFSGSSTSRTISRRQSAVIHTVVTSRFVGTKPIAFDLDRGFRYGEATSRVSVVSTQRDVQSTVGGLRGRLVRRIATRRLNALSGYLDGVAEQSTAERIEHSFDREANRRLVALNTAFHGVRLALRQQALQGNGGMYDLSLNTTDRYLQIGIGLKGTANPELPDEGVPPLPVQVWVHASIFGEQAVPLVKTWDELRVLLPTPSNVSGLAAALRMPQQWQNAVPQRSLELTTATPWVVVGAGREQGQLAREPQVTARRF